MQDASIEINKLQRRVKIVETALGIPITNPPSIIGGGTINLGGYTIVVPVSGTIAIGAGTLTATTINDVSGASHTHAITSSSNPGAAASLLATDASGYITVVKINGLTLSTLPIGGLAVATAANTLGSLAVGLTTQVLVGGGAGTVPAWGADLPTAVTIGSAYIYRASGTDIPVADGGTGASTLALNGILYGNAASAVGVTAIGAQYKVLTVGASPFVPVFSSYLLDGTSGGKTIMAVTNAKVLTLTATDTYGLTVAGTGSISGTNTGDQTITLTGAVTGSGTGSIATTIATPGTLSAASTNSTATAHTHAITSSANPGAAASLLATDASGYVQLVRLGVGAAPAKALHITSGDTSYGSVRISGTGHDSDATGEPSINFTNLDHTDATSWVMGMNLAAAVDGSFAWYYGGTKVTFLTNGDVGIGTASPSALIHGIKTTEQLRLGYDVSNYLSITVGSGGNATLAPTGDMILDPVGNDVLPATNYDINIGSLSKKYLTLHAAELWVETLVAQNTIATIGGRVLVGPTTILTSDLAPADTTIYVKHNEMASGDRVYLEANGSVEFMAITGAPGGAGPYSYTVTRNLDGSGANQWYAGDAVFNTGTTGSGFIDLYSVAGIKSAGIGPTIVGNVRNSATYNDWTEHWAIGQLNGLYGYGVSTFGVGLGEYAAAKAHVTLDSTNGLRFFTGLSTVVGQWAADGTITVGQVAASQNNVLISAGALSIRNNTTERIGVTAAGILTIKDSSGAAVITLDASAGAEITKKLTMPGANSAIAIGATPPTSATVGTGLWLDRTGLYGLAANVQQAIFDATTGKITAGAGAVQLSATGININPVTGIVQTLQWQTTGDANAIGTLWALRSSSGLAYDTFYIEKRSRDGTNLVKVILGQNLVEFDINSGTAIYDFGATVATMSGGLNVGTATGAGVGVVAVSQGIAFPATQNASADANTLDDYEEGTWTPVRVSFTESGGGTITNSGVYTKIGRLVWVRAKMVCAGGAVLTCVANTSYLSGLPFAAADWSPCLSVCENTGLGGVGAVQGAYLDPASWTGAANQTFVVSAVYNV